LAEGVGVGDGAEEKELWLELQPTTKMVTTTRTAPAQACTNLWFIANPTIVPNHHIFQRAVFARLLAQEKAGSTFLVSYESIIQFQGRWAGLRQLMTINRN
jgi:hypothetical protein